MSELGSKNRKKIEASHWYLCC